MYSQYRSVNVALCLELPAGATAIEGAASFVNPMTVLGMVETMRMENHSALVHTAAASNLGQMLSRLCVEQQVPLVNIVRKPDQEAMLRAAGAVHVCNSTSAGFMAELTGALTATGATLAFDAIGGGRLASQILTGMEAAASAAAGGYSRYGSAVHKQVYIYGSLDRGPTELIRSYGMAWGIGGWLLTPFLQKAGLARVAQLRDQVAAGLTTTFASSYTAQVSGEIKTLIPNRQRPDRHARSRNGCSPAAAGLPEPARLRERLFELAARRSSAGQPDLFMRAPEGAAARRCTKAIAIYVTSAMAATGVVNRRGGT